MKEIILQKSNFRCRENIYICRPLRRLRRLAIEYVKKQLWIWSKKQCKRLTSLRSAYLLLTSSLVQLCPPFIFLVKTYFQLVTSKLRLIRHPNHQFICYQNWQIIDSSLYFWYIEDSPTLELIIWTSGAHQNADETGIIQRLVLIRSKSSITSIFHTWKYVFNGSYALCNDHVI